MSESKVSAGVEAWVLEQFLSRLSDAISSMMGEVPRVGAAGAPLESPADEGMLWWEQAFSISSDATLCVGAPAESWRTIGNTVLISAGIENADSDNIKSTFIEILSQSFSGLAQVLSGRIRTEVNCAEGAETSSPPPTSYPAVVNLGDADLRLFVAGSKSLFESCDKSAAVTPFVAGSVEKAGAPQNTPVDVRPYPKGLDLLLDVELPLSVSFGRAQLPIKDVMKLTSGSIVELNKSITEPVEVIVNNVVIARGEVVVLEGNFGIRIKQVISRQERLRTLR